MLIHVSTCRQPRGYRRLIAVGSICLLLLASACGGPETIPEAASRNTQQTTRAVIAAARQAEVPVGVEPALYVELVTELERVLNETELNRVVSAPPSGDGNQIKDLTFTDMDTDSYSLSWSYTNAGDYDRNSEVNIADLAVIGQNFGATLGDPDWDTHARIADGDGNGEVNIADVTAIGRHFGMNVQGYHIYRAPDADSTPVIIGSVQFSELTEPTEKFVYTVMRSLDTPGGFVADNAPIFSVVPFDKDSEEPTDISTAAQVQGDAVVLYSSSLIDDYQLLNWHQDPGGADGTPPIPDWIYARFTHLTPDVQPVPSPDQALGEFVGRAVPQTIEARFNLTRGSGKITLTSEDGSMLTRLRGGEGAFTVELTSDVAANAPFKPGSLAATPFVIINRGEAVLTVEEFRVGEIDYVEEMGDVTGRVGVFFPENPFDIELAAALPPWAEKWCMILDTTGKIPDLQEY